MDEKDAAQLAALRGRREAIAQTLRRVKWARLGYALPLLASFAAGVAGDSWHGPKIAMALSGMAAAAVEYCFLVTWLRYRTACVLEACGETTAGKPEGLVAPEAEESLILLKRSLDKKGMCLAGAGMIAASLAAWAFWSRTSRMSYDVIPPLGMLVTGAIAVNCAAILVMLGIRMVAAGVLPDAAKKRDQAESSVTG